jgi:hypothetical protein
MTETCPYTEKCEQYGIREDCSKETLTRCRLSYFRMLQAIRKDPEPKDYPRPKTLDPFAA